MALQSGASIAPKTDYFSKVSYLIELSQYVPTLVIQQMIKKQKQMAQDGGKQKVNTTSQEQVPESQDMETVVMFADISGFTNLSEACARKGVQGNEEVALSINRYMDGMVNYLNQYGGDIIKFVGDAMIVMWPPIDTESAQSQEERVETIRKAIQCSIDIQKHMNDFKFRDGITLSVKIGIGYGKCQILYAGGFMGRQETLTVGDALVQALQSEGMASGGGEVIVSEPCYQHVREFFKSTEMLNARVERFHLIDLRSINNANRVKISASGMKIRSKFKTEVLSRIQPMLEKCIPQCVIPYLRIEKAAFASEIRSLTVMFISLGVDLSSAGTAEGMAKIQNVVTTVQQQVYRLEGSINKLVMDDKGSTMICIFGLQPVAHSDDAQRALLTGFNMIRALNKIGRTYCNIGVSSGECFAGIVGTSGSRKEFSVLGDVVNLAARIMGSIKEKGVNNKMKCDLNTRMLAGDAFDFSYQGHIELKGKSISTPIYSPHDPQQLFKMATQKGACLELFLKVHQNPMQIERETNNLRSTLTIGFSQSISMVVDSLVNYYTERSHKSPYLQIIKGQLGSGKTAFMRHFFSELSQTSDIEEYLARQNKSKLPFFTSHINADTRLQFLNIWRPIFQRMLQFYSTQQRLKKENFIADLIIHKELGMLTELICEIVGVERKFISQKKQKVLSQPENSKQISPIEKENQVLKMIDYETSHKESLICFLTDLFKILINDKEAENFDNSMDSQKQAQEEGSIDSSSDESSNGTMRTPFIVCLDDAQLMCPTSWMLLEQILANSSLISIFLIVQSDEQGKLMIQQNSISSFQPAWERITCLLKIYFESLDMPTLSEEQIGELIVSNAKDYKASYTDEIEDMTKILDPQNTIKNEEVSQGLRATYLQQQQLLYEMKSIDPLLLQVITKRSEYNPLLSLHYFINMLHNDFAEVQATGRVVPTEKLISCQKINDWSTLPTPRLVKRIVQSALSQFFASILFNPKRKPGELVEATVALLLLKVSSVLGREFSLDALRHIQPIYKTSSQLRLVDEAIHLLEKRGFIEIVDVCGENKKTVCRFISGKLCDTVYQMLRYKANKMDLHRATEQFIQMQPSVLRCRGDDTSTKTLILSRHMLLASNCSEEKDLMLHQRTALVVLRIQHLLQSNPRSYIFREELMKPLNQGKGATVKNKFRETKLISKFVTLSQFNFKWYQTEKEMNLDQYRGCVDMRFIYDVVSIKMKDNSPSFRISVSMHINEKGKEAGKRDITFSCHSPQDRDRWIAAIDYLKTRSIYDAYAKKNTLVNFLGHDKKEEQRDDSENRVEINFTEYLHGFGNNFRQSIGHVGAASLVSMNQSTGKTIPPLGRLGTFMSNSIGKPDQMLTRTRTSVLQAQNQQNQVERHVSSQELVFKLQLLYKTNMTSFLHHLDPSNLSESNIVGISHAQDHDGGQSMQFPPLQSLDQQTIIENLDFANSAQKRDSGNTDSDQISNASSKFGFQKRLTLNNVGNRRASFRSFVSMKSSVQETNTLEQNKIFSEVGKLRRMSSTEEQSPQSDILTNDVNEQYRRHSTNLAEERYAKLMNHTDLKQLDQEDDQIKEESDIETSSFSSQGSPTKINRAKEEEKEQAASYLTFGGSAGHIQPSPFKAQAEPQKVPGSEQMKQRKFPYIDVNVNLCSSGQAKAQDLSKSSMSSYQKPVPSEQKMDQPVDQAPLAEEDKSYNDSRLISTPGHGNTDMAILQLLLQQTQKIEQIQKQIAEHSIILSNNAPSQDSINVRRPDPERMIPLRNLLQSQNNQVSLGSMALSSSIISRSNTLTTQERQHEPLHVRSRSRGTQNDNRSLNQTLPSNNPAQPPSNRVQSAVPAGSILNNSIISRSTVNDVSFRRTRHRNSIRLEQKSDQCQNSDSEYEAQRRASRNDLAQINDCYEEEKKEVLNSSQAADQHLTSKDKDGLARNIQFKLNSSTELKGTVQLDKSLQRIVQDLDGSSSQCRIGSSVKFEPSTLPIDQEGEMIGIQKLPSQTGPKKQPSNTSSCSSHRTASLQGEGNSSVQSINNQQNQNHRQSQEEIISMRNILPSTANAAASLQQQSELPENNPVVTFDYMTEPDRQSNQSVVSSISNKSLGTESLAREQQALWEQHVERRRQTQLEMLNFNSLSEMSGNESFENMDSDEEGQNGQNLVMSRINNVNRRGNNINDQKKRQSKKILQERLTASLNGSGEKKKEEQTAALQRQDSKANLEYISVPTLTMTPVKKRR